MEKIFLHKEDLKIINDIVKENDIKKFELCYENSSGIGYALYLEYETTMKNREVLVRIPIVSVENW